MAGGNFGGGDGTLGNPYLVEDLADLNAVRNNTRAHYLQINDIVGGSIDSINGPLEGIYNGGFCTIEEITIEGKDEISVGLFMLIMGGTVQNVIMKNCVLGGYIDVGGIAGQMYGGNINRCCVIDTKFTSGEYIGYIVGNIVIGESKISECFAANTVQSNSLTANGILGIMLRHSNPTIINCYYRNHVATNINSGIFTTASTDYNVSSCYTSFRGGNNAIGNVVGGAVGQEPVNPPAKCYYDSEFSGLSGGYGMGRSTAEMKVRETFVGWNFSIWGIDENINDGYPYLRWYPYDLAEGMLSLYAKKNEIWHKAKDLYAKKNGVWSKAKDLYGNKQGWNKSQ